MTDVRQLAAFLLARLAEREQEALRARAYADGDELWVVTGADNGGHDHAWPVPR